MMTVSWFDLEYHLFYFGGTDVTKIQIRALGNILELSLLRPMSAKFESSSLVLSRLGK